MRKVNVVGTSGSGKSTFSSKLADALGCDHIEMDALFWKPNWQESNDEELFNKIRGALNGPSWVLDGNYNRTRQVKWQDVDTVVWIDYSLPRTLYQAATRAIKRCCSGQELWPNTGNRETFKKSFFSRNSILLWTLKTYHSNQKRYLADMANPEYQHIEFIRLQTPDEAKRLLSQLSLSNAT